MRRPVTRSSEAARYSALDAAAATPPTVQPSHVTSLDKYLGPSNIEVAGQPLDGRSGGGLYSGDGCLVGVCNAADPKDNEGIFAGLGTIHGQLDRIGQSALYRPQPPAPQVASNSRAEANPPRTDLPPPSMPPQMPLPAAAESGPSPDRRVLADNDTEVICIVRSKSRPQGHERLLILSQPSLELIERLNRESRPLDERAAAIALQPESEPRGPAAWPRTASAAEGGSLRAQSPDR